MQKQIGQQWASHAPLGSALLPRNQPPVLFLHWCFQPALDIENDPLLRSMLRHCPMTSDSRSCKDSFSTSCQNLRSTAHRPLLLLYLLLPSCTLPKPPSWKYKTALPHSSGSSHRWLSH